MKEKALLTFLAISILIFALDRTTAVFSPARNVISIVTAPVQYSLYHLTLEVSDTFSFLTFWRSGEERIRNLEQRNLELAGYKAKAEDLQKENAVLTAQLGVQPLQEKKMLPARVLGVGQRMEISVGSNDGVIEGMTVVYLNNLVGRLVRVTPKESFVVLAGDPISKIPAKDGIFRGLAVGRFGTGIVLTQIAQTDEVGAGDEVLTSGEGKTYFQNLMIGKIKQVAGAKTDLFREAVVEPEIDFQKLTIVFVILD